MDDEEEDEDANNNDDDNNDNDDDDDCGWQDFWNHPEPLGSERTKPYRPKTGMVRPCKIV